MHLRFKKSKHSPDIYLDQKEEYFDFDRISSYSDSKKDEPCFQRINDHTWKDLDMDEVFMSIDRTHSRPGQQYLFHLLKTIPSSDRAKKVELIISKIEENERDIHEIVLALRKLGNRGAYFLHLLFTRKNLEKPKWFWIIYFLFFSTVSSLFLSVFYPSVVLVLIGLVICNFIVHYWNKNNLMEYANGISQLNSLNRIGPLLFPFFQDEKKEISEATSSLNKIVRRSALLKSNSYSQNEFAVISEVLIELIKAIFLIESILLFSMTSEIEKKKGEIERVFKAIGLMDSCISINSLRKKIRYYTIPKEGMSKNLHVTNCYHPLINDPISNSITIENDKSVLISGSNMSGKTTFIRTIGVNALLGQTINTVFAKEWSLPKSKIYSAIRISDDLLNDESFYQKEVQVIKEMVERSKGKSNNLFLIDELFKGTNSIERIGAGAAVLSYLNTDASVVFASTHDLELTTFLEESYSFYHFTEKVNTDEISFDYKLNEGKLRNTNAIKILEIYKYPESVTNDAKRIAKELSKN